MEHAVWWVLWVRRAGRRDRALLSHHSRWALAFVFNKIIPGGQSSALCVRRCGRGPVENIVSQAPSQLWVLQVRGNHVPKSLGSS